METSHTHRTLQAQRAGQWVLLLLAAFTLAACDRGKSGGSATQIAARVNKEEISVHQINFALQRQPGLTQDQLEGASRKTLEALVDQELVLQAAVEQHLDRDPIVIQSVEAARRELLARAYAERLTASVQAPSAADVKQYYDGHPALFAKRRFYSLVDTAVDATPAQQKEIQAQLAATHTATEVSAVLTKAGLRHGARYSKVGAEALPLQSVDAIAALHEGQSFLIGGPTDAHILTIESADPAPLTLEQARASIESFLTMERKRDLLQQQVKTLRSTAQIEYRGRFASPAVAASPNAPVPAADAASELKSVAAIK